MLAVTLCRCFKFASLTEPNSDGELTFASRRVCRARRPMGGIYLCIKGSLDQPEAGHVRGIILAPHATSFCSQLS